jgi:hypothetical protein
MYCHPLLCNISIEIEDFCPLNGLLCAIVGKLENTLATGATCVSVAHKYVHSSSFREVTAGQKLSTTFLRSLR